ncbi:MAG: ADP-ribosylation factor family protein [Promethearchaeota archaeon]
MKQLFPTGEGKEEITCALIGLDNAGKTTILQRLRKGELISTAPTLGYNIEAIQIETGFQLNVFDLGGQVSFRSIWKNFLDRADLLIYVVDAADTDRLDESKAEFERALKFLREKIPIVFMSNKKDLDNRASIDDLMDLFEINQLETAGHKTGIIETCALTSEGLREAFYWIYETITGRTIEQPEFHAPLECLGNGKFVCLWRKLQRCSLGVEECKGCDIALCQNCENFKQEICPKWSASA